MDNQFIRFYDNDKSRFTGISEFMKKKIKCIHIDDTEPNKIFGKNNYFLNLYSFEDFYYKEYIKKFKHKSVHLKKLAHRYPEITIEEKVSSNGIDTLDIKELKIWSSMENNNLKKIFFDWDRTLSVCDGFYSIEKYTKKELEEYIMFLFGGPKRFEEIQKLFEFLHKHHVKIYILTNNNAASIKNKKRRIFFLKIISFLDPLFYDKNLLYGLKYNDIFDKNYKLLKSNKINFLEKELKIL